MQRPLSLRPPAARLLGASLVALSLAGAAQAAVDVDTTGIGSLGLLGDDGNTVLQIDIGAFSRLDALDWSVRLEAFAPSTLAELQVSFGGSTGLDTLTLAPAAADGFSGTGDYSGRVDLRDLGLFAGADGLLRIEFSEAYKDAAAGVADGQWLSGTLRFQVSPVPEPATMALWLLGLGAIGLVARGRRAPAS